MSAEQALADFNDLFNSTTETVPQNKVEYFNFATSEKQVRSSGFAGCFGVVVAGKQACIVAHMSQTRDAVTAAKDAIQGYFETFPGTLLPSKVYIYAQVELQTRTKAKYSELYNDLFASLEELTESTPILVGYIDPIEACLNQNGTPIPGTSPEKCAFGKLVIKSDGDRVTEPTVQFITIDMQFLEVQG
ncbi:hypothetical protein PISL3812_08115 [Talaromyces islandicus]|uniref:Uncharacterized protein n=1 Tax=Talaromyces islandicus TaxID=28573 RepID=A0A0U1M6B6_TALIS|nr:hypothetical protein PISL3812_08115 [Talaromyces islandicus]